MQRRPRIKKLVLDLCSEPRELYRLCVEEVKTAPYFCEQEYGFNLAECVAMEDKIRMAGEDAEVFQGAPEESIGNTSGHFR